MRKKERDISFLRRRRKRTGWIFGAYGTVSFLMNLVIIVLLSILLDLLWRDFQQYENYVGDPFVPVIASYMIYMTIFAIIVFSILALFSLVKVASGILLHRGKRVGALIFLFSIGMSFPLFMALITFIITLTTPSAGGLLLLLLILLDVGVWSYFLWTLVTSWRTLKGPQKKRLKRGDVDVKKMYS